MTIYLYLKTHNVTGLKYLGKTIKDPYVYKGSGKMWVRHIKKYGYDVTTQILLVTDCKEELKETGLFFSKLWAVDKSNEFANLCQEEGQGGNTWDKRGRYVSEYTREKQSKSRIGKKKSEEWKNMMRKPKSAEHRSKISKSKIGVTRPTIRCIHCNREISVGNYHRWHGDKCRSLAISK